MIITNLISVASENKTKSDATGYESYISIQGSSNINNFKLVNQSPDLENFNIGDLVKNSVRSDTFERIRIDVREFICRNQLLCQDFQNMLNAPEYPFIDISIKRQDFPGNYETGKIFNLKTKISIAGVTRNYIIPCRIDSFNNSAFELTGSKRISLTDFNLNPPKKVFGAIKVRNDVFINFAIRFPVNNIYDDNSYVETGSTR